MTSAPPPPPSLTYYPVAQYDGPTKLANQLHSYPHYDFARHQVPVSPETTIDNWRPYAESLASIFLLPVILFLIFLIIDIIVRCVFACRSPRHDLDSASYKPKQYRCCDRYQPYWDRKWAIAMVLAASTLIIVFVALGMLGSTNKDLDKTIDALKDAQAYEDRLIYQGNRGDSSITTLNDILATKLGGPSFNQFNNIYTRDIYNILRTTQLNVDQASSQLKSFLGDSASYRFAADMIKATNQGRDILRSLMIAVFILFFFTFIPLLILRTFFSTKRTCINVMQMIAVVACFVAWAVAMVMVASSVGVADVCQQPNAYIHQYFKAHPDKYQKSVVDVVDYYVYCPISAVAATYLQNPDPAQNPFTNPLYTSPLNKNPLYDALAKGYEATTNIATQFASNTYQQGKKQLKQQDQDALTQLENFNTATADLLKDIVVDSSCIRLNNDFSVAVNTICKDLLNHWWGVAVCLALSTLFYLVMRCFIRTRQRIVSGDVEGNGGAPMAVIVTPVYEKYESPQSVDPQFSSPIDAAPQGGRTSQFAEPLAPAPIVATTQGQFIQQLSPSPSPDVSQYGSTPNTQFQQPLASAPPSDQLSPASPDYNMMQPGTPEQHASAPVDNEGTR